MKEVSILELDPYPFKLGFCDNKKAWKKFCKEVGLGAKYEFIPDSDACCMTFDTSTGTAAVVCIDYKVQKKKSLSSTIGLLAHECVHAFASLCEEIGEKNPSSEFSAYTIQYFVQFCYDCMYDDKKEDA